MLSNRRKALILERLKTNGQIVAKTLSAELQLSEDTIRRDLRELASTGLLQRVHGGALPASPAVADLRTRQHIGNDAKNKIGRIAAHHIQTNHIVILDGGTTAVQVARHIPLGLTATIVTHSPNVAVELEQHTNLEVLLLGGRLFKHSMVATGAATIAAISHIRADLCFVGVTGLHPKAGLTTGDLEEAHIKRALMHAAAETFVLASGEKIGAASPYFIAPIQDATGIITEASPDQTAAFEDLGLHILRA